MTAGTTASRPPAGLPGLDPAWSRLVPVADPFGTTHTFHVLDTWAGREPDDQPTLTVLCLHGNPTWSYLWRRLLAAAPPEWRVVAPDHLGMGYSDRPSRPRRLAERVEDLSRLTEALDIRGPVITVAHDWGGILSMGWAAAHRDQLRGIVLTNTAVHLPAPARGPILIRLAHRRWLNRVAVRWTPLFVRTTTSLTWPRPARNVRNAYAAPYSTSAQRAAVAEFVRDVPFAAGHPSHAAVERIAREMTTFDVPALLLWGPRDPVFGDLFLRDIQSRLPGSVLQRYERASHLLPEDAPAYAGAIVDWVGAQTAPAAAPEASAGPEDPDAQRVSALDELDRRSSSTEIAVTEVGGSSITWAALHTRVAEVGAGLAAAGVGPGVRVALMVPPSIELTVALYAVWRAGGVIVVADKGLGLRGMGRALRSARLDYVIADYPGLIAARPMRLPGRRVAVRELPAVVRSALAVEHSFDDLVRVGRTAALPPQADADDEAAVLFTSGATGPAKGVLYRHRQVSAQLDLVRSVYGLTGADRLVAAFAPFALFGPALGIRSAVPDVDVTRPGTLTAIALADAAIALDATVVFASPAALRNVLATATALTPVHRAALAKVRLVASFGAPIPVHLLEDLSALLPGASMHTPYGMTEAFPLTNISLPEIIAAGPSDGVCVGRPLPGVEFAVAPLDDLGLPSETFADEPGVTGEIWVRAAHIRDRYDTLWVLNRAAAAHPGRHRTGDVGHLDAAGQLWIQGRLEHVITTAAGPVTPVGIEQRVEAAFKTAGTERAAAAVGVGPAGRQQVVVVVTGSGRPLAGLGLIDAVRAAAGVEVAAVLVKHALPLDIRHNSKIDRQAVAAWAERVLAGG